MPNNEESTQPVSSENGSPNPASQGAQGVSSNSLDVDAIVAKVTERLLPELDKRTQSTKDKRIAEILKTMDEMKKSLTGEGSNQVDAPTPQGTPTSPVTTQPAQTQPAAQAQSVEVDTIILGRFQLTKDDPAVIAVQHLPVEQRIVEYSKITDRRAQPPNEAAIASQGGEPIKNISDLWAELDDLQMQDPLDRSGRQAALRKELGHT